MKTCDKISSSPSVENGSRSDATLSRKKDTEIIRKEIDNHLFMLCETIGERPTGSLNNRKAQDYIRKNLEACGYAVELQEFDVNGWIPVETRCTCAGKIIPVVANPYSPSCSVTAPAVPVKTKEELGMADLKGKIAILYGDLTREPLMPRNFRFYLHEEHRALLELLEEKEPAAIIMVSPHPDHAIPVIIDGDFHLPSCTVAARDGAALLAHDGVPVSLIIKTEIQKTRSANVIGRKGKLSEKKIVLSAHFDTKFFTPGALDNASGVTALLVLARSIQEMDSSYNLEFVFFNGEECYCSPGESVYLDAGYCTPDRVFFGINVDGIGLLTHQTSISYYGTPEKIPGGIRAIERRYDHIARVDPWPQGDHMIFFMQNIPSLAFSTKADADEMNALIHTAADTTAVLDKDQIQKTIAALEEIVRLAKDRELHA